MDHLALLGAGPSLKGHLGELQAFIVAVTNHAHDFVVEHGIVPHMAILTETKHKKTINPVAGCTYYVRNDALIRPDTEVVEYPCEWITTHFPALDVALHLTAHVHLFGFDACRTGEATHCDGAYDYGDKECERLVGDRTFITNARWLRQVGALLSRNNDNITVHGDGFLAHAWRTKWQR